MRTRVWYLLCELWRRCASIRGEGVANGWRSETVDTTCVVAFLSVCRVRRRQVHGFRRRLHSEGGGRGARGAGRPRDPLAGPSAGCPRRLGLAAPLRRRGRRRRGGAARRGSARAAGPLACRRWSGRARPCRRRGVWAEQPTAGAVWGTAEGASWDDGRGGWRQWRRRGRAGRRGSADLRSVGCPPIQVREAHSADTCRSAQARRL